MKAGSGLMLHPVFCLLVVGHVYFAHALPQEDLLTKKEPKCQRKPAEKVLFSSDNFPSNYNKETECSYVMKADPGKRVLLTFYMFQTETNSRCSYDRVEVYDSNDTTSLDSSKTLIHKFCGRNSNNVYVNSSKEYLELRFITDRVSEYSGFLASWQQVHRCGLCLGQS